MALASYFRSKERDIATDVDRVLPIRDAVERAIRDSRRELTGLQERLAQASSSAAFLFGDTIEGETAGNSIAEARLRESEQVLVRGQMRERYLTQQLAALEKVRTLLEEIVQPQTKL
jgi:hypothetical protein